MAKERETEIEAARQFIKNHVKHVSKNVKEAVRNFKKEMGKKD